MDGVTISNAGPHGLFTAATRFPSSQGGIKGYNTGSQVSDYLTGTIPPLNVKSAGLKGDGTTNDFPALAALLSSLPVDFGGELFFPSGKYK